MTMDAPENQELVAQHIQVHRMTRLLRRFVRDTDAQVNDRDFVRKLIDRWQRHDRDEPGDPNA